MITSQFRFEHLGEKLTSSSSSKPLISMSSTVMPCDEPAWAMKMSFRKVSSLASSLILSSSISFSCKRNIGKASWLESEKYCSHLLKLSHFVHSFFGLLPSLFSRLFHSVIILLSLLSVVEIIGALLLFSDIPRNLPWHFHRKLYIFYNFWVSWGSWEFHAGVVF